MICKDCKPLRYHSNAVELCEKHATAEACMTATSLVISEYEAEAKERRRYALLQAAATLLPKYIDVASAEAIKGNFNHYIRVEPRRIAVTEAIELLAEIEKREPETQG